MQTPDEQLHRPETNFRPLGAEPIQPPRTSTRELDVQRRWLKVALGLSYLFFIAQCFDAVHAGYVADEQHLVGDSVIWFGPFWPGVLLATLIAIILIHITLRNSAQLNSREPH